MEKRWTVVTPATNGEPADPDISKLKSSLGIAEPLCRLLVSRGIRDFESARTFFRPSFEGLHDPFLMKDMAEAVERIQLAISRNERVLIFGDYDVDGTSSVAALYRFLKPLLPQTDFYIPHRFREGYGVSRAGIDHAISKEFTLIISVDCGIKSAPLIRYAADNGIDFIVCDHHLPDTELPPAVAILNPKQQDCNYPYKELCGCGVVLKLVQALGIRLSPGDDPWKHLLDLAALAIAADIVPLTGENRIIAWAGLKRINDSPGKGIAALLQAAGVRDKEIQISQLVFVVAPRINAAGRMDEAGKAVRLFLEDDPKKAALLAAELCGDNSERQEADANTTQEALALLAADPRAISARTTVLHQTHWHKGVIGIVASRLIETWYRPTVMLTTSGSLITGSARSVTGFDLHEAIHACREHLTAYGGHYAAAGLSMLPESLCAFREKFEEVVAASITEDLLQPKLLVDIEVRLSDLTHSFYNILRQMEPFGPGNLKPVLMLKHVYDNGYSRIVKEQHLRFSVMQDGRTMTGIGFGLADKLPLLQQGPVDIAFTLDLDEWNGEKRLQMKVIDVRIAQDARSEQPNSG